MRFIEYLPIIEEPLLVCPDGTDISVSFYLFNKAINADNPEGEGFSVMNYAHETAYAYRQLMELTNIAECGRVRIFLDQRCEPQMRPYFEKIGLGSLIEIIDVPMGVRLSGYIPQFSHPAVLDCKYRFHCDVDLWWFTSDGTEEKFDWRAFCDFLDTADDDSFFGQPIEKPDWVYQINYSQHALPEEVQGKALETLTQIFGPRIPDMFHEIAYQPNPVLKERNELSPLRCLAGWFVGVRDDSVPLWYLNRLYDQYEDYLGDDEGLYSLLFYLHPELRQFKVLQGVGEAKPNEIKQGALTNWKQLEGVGTINVGAQEFYMEEFVDARNELAAYFRGETETSEPIESQPEPERANVMPPAPNGLCTFGKHITGTYALDPSGNVFPLLSHTNCNHSVMFGFPAAFPPIKDPLVVSRKESTKLAIFYCLFHHPLHAIHDLHVYAKSMTYAYKQLVRHTNILDVGNVYFFVDERAMDIVHPYCREANISELIVPFHSDKQVQYAAYIPCFWHQTLNDIQYRFYMDVDMWWVNAANDEKFDYQHLIDALDTQECDIYGLTVPKTEETTAADLYQRCVWDGDTHLKQTRQWMADNFGAESPSTEQIRAISGCHNGMREGETLQALRDFYEEVEGFIRDDEALWTIFLTKNPQFPISKISDIIDGTGFYADEFTHHSKAELAHIGTYMFEHFFNKPYAQTFYNHCLEV